MKRTSTLTQFFKLSILIFTILSCITFVNTKSYAQTKTYATVTPGTSIQDYNIGSETPRSDGSGGGSVTNAANAVSVPSLLPAVLNAKYSTLLGLLGHEGEAAIQLKSSDFTGKTVLIPFDQPFASEGGALDLLNLIGDLTGLFTKKLVVIEAYANATAASAGTLVPAANVSAYVVTDANGKNYFAVNSTDPFNSVKVRLRTRNALLSIGSGTLSMNVYTAFTYAGDNCGSAIATSVAQSGLNVSLTSLVINPKNAIDGNVNTSSQIQAGLVSLASTVSQTVILGSVSGPDDVAKVILSQPGSILTVNVLKTITVQAYNGMTPVGQPLSLSSLINLDLLGLFSNGRQLPVFFTPGAPFDRIKVSVDNTLAVGQNILAGGLNIHEGQRTVAKPSFANVTGGVAGVCGNKVDLAVTAPNPAFTYNLYKKTGTTIAPISTASASGVFSETNVAPGTYTYYLSAQKAGCTAESDLDSVKVTVTKAVVPGTVAQTAICAGSNGVFIVNNVEAGQTYKWYNDETGGVSIFTGSTYDVGSLSANKTLYLETSNGPCVAAARTAVTITVNPIPQDAQVSANSLTISRGQTATLTAIAPTAGSTIEWYELQSGGTAVATGATFITPVLTANKTYYVGTRNATGCVSTNRVAVTINVLGITTGATCKSANAQSNGVTGLLCVLCGVTDPGNAVDADPTNYSTLRLTVSVGASAYQRLIFPNAGLASDSIRLDLGSPVGLADLSVLGGITVNVMNGSQIVKSYPLNSQLLHLALLGGNRFKVTLPVTAVYDRVELSLGAIVGALTSLDVYGAEVIYPNPTVPATGLAICSGGSTSITATPIGGTDLKWFANPTGGSPLATGNTYAPTGLTETTTYYIEVSKGTCINTERMPVKVTVNPAIVFNPTTLSNPTVGSNYSKQITPATGGTPGFTYALASGSTLPAGLTLSPAGVISGKPTAGGPSTFSVIVTDSKGCNATATFSLSVTDALALGTATLPNGTTNVLYPTQTLPTATGGTGPYIYTATNLPPGLTLDKDTHQISGTPTQAGTYPVKVTVTDANGNTVTQDYSIIVRDALVLATAPLADGTVGEIYPTQTIPAATGGAGSFTYTATGLPAGLTFNELTREITGTPTTAGPYTVSVTVKDADGKTATTDYTINVKSPLVLASGSLPDGNVNVAYTSLPIPAATGGTGPYTYAAATANLPAGLTFDAATRTVVGTPTQSGLYTIPVTVTDGAGKKVTANYTLRVIGALSLPTASLANGNVGTAYAGETLPEVSGGTGPYTYQAANLPPGLNFDPLTRKLTGTPTLGGTFTFSVTAKDAGGNSTTTNFSVLVKVDAPTVAATTVCAGTTATLNITAPISGVTYNWYGATGSTPLTSGTSFTTPVLTTNTTYYAEAVSGTAVSTRTTVNVTVRPAPALAVVTGNQSISAGQTATLQATAGTGNTLAWYAAATGGPALSTNATFTTPVLNTSTTYYVETQNAAGCVSLTRVPVLVTVTNGPVNPKCNAAVKQTSGIEGLLCIGCTVNNAGGSIDTDPTTFTNINLLVGLAGSGYQRLTFANSGSATDSIRLNLSTPVGLADVGVLGGITATILNGGNSVKSYSLNSSLLNLRLLGGNKFSVTLPATGVYDGVEIRIANLVTALTSLDIYSAEVIYPNPAVSATGTTTCAGSTTTLTAAAKGGTTLKWYADATGGTALQTGETFTTPVLTATTTYYIEVIKGTCANELRVPVTVTVTPAPNAPVLATVLPVCYGSTASLTVGNAVAGLNYNWYTTVAGTTPVFTGATFVTPALTASTTYYVEAISPGCGGSTRTAVAVPVNPIVTLPQIQASATTIAPGQTAVLTATSADTDVTFNWYTTSTGTTPVFTGATYVTPPLSANTTYYLEAKSNTTGCLALSRVQVTITVDNSLPSPVPCLAATSETHDVVGVALLSAIFNPGLAIDNDTRTGSSIVMPVGALGAYAYQRLGFGSLSSVGDTVKVLLNAPGKLLSLGLLSSIQVGTYNGATSNGDGVSINNSLIHLELLSNNSQALISFVPTLAFDQVEVRLNAGLAGVLSTVDVNYARRISVAPTLTAPNPTVCSGQTATLTVLNPNPAITYKWYNAAGAPLTTTGNGSSFTTDVLTANATYFVEANTASGCASVRTKVNVTVTAVPDAPVLVSADIKTCPGSDVTLEVKNPIVGMVYKWYDAANVYQTGKDGTTFTITNVTASTSYSVEAFLATCSNTSSRTTAQINTTGLDIPIITPPAITVASGSVAVLTATSSTAGVIFKWYDAPVNGTLLSSDARYEFTPAANNGNTPRIDKYYVSAEIPGGCTALTRASVEVTVLPAKTPTDVPCEPATAQIKDGVDGIALLTAVFNPERAVDNNAESASSLVMPVGALGASVYQQVGFNGISTVGDTIKVRLSSPGKLLKLGVLPSIEFTTFNGTVSNNDMIVASNPLIDLELLSQDSDYIFSFVPAKPFDRVELRLRSGLASVLSTLDFNYARRVLVAPKVSAANASACVGTATTLSVQNPSPDGGPITYTWFKGTTQVGTGSTYLTDATLAVGPYDYYVTATRNGCASAKTKVTLTVLAAPDAPVAVSGNPTSICPNEVATLAVTPVAGVTYNWFDAVTAGNKLASNTSTYTTAANLAPGIYSFFVEASNGNSCISTAARTEIKITVKRLSTANDIAVTGADAAVCKDNTATLTASSTIGNASFKWFADADLTIPLVSTAVYQPVVTATTTFYVTVSGDGVCDGGKASAKAVTVVVNPPATAADLSVTGNGAPFCAGAKATLTASTNTVNSPTFVWYSDPALTKEVFRGAIYEPTLTVSTTFYVTVSGTNKCPNLPADAKLVSVTVNDPATAADITVTGNGTPFCAGAKASLTASSTVINPKFIWYSDANLQNEVFRGAVYEPTVTATTNYYVIVSGDNKCPNDAANAKVVAITVNTPATTADIKVIGNDAPFCKGSKAKLTASTTTVDNPVFTWYTDADLTNAVFTGPVFEPTLTATTTYYVTVRGSNRCESLKAGAIANTLVVNPPALSTDINVKGNDAPFCNGTEAVLTAESAISNPIFTWYRNSDLTDVAFTGPVFKTALTTTTTFYVTVRGSNKCENGIGDAKIVTLVVNPPATASDVIVSGAETAICAGTTVKLTASSTTVTNPVFTWYTDAALNNAVFTGPVLEKPLTQTTTYYVTVKGANRCENLAGNGKPVTVTVNELPEVPIVNNGAAITICSGDGTTLTVQNPQAGVTYQWYNAATNGTLLGSGASLPVTGLTTTTDYYVQATSASGCGVATGRVKVTVNVSIRPGIPTVASAAVNTCLGATATLNVSNPVTGVTYNWYATATSTAILGSGNSFVTPATTAATTTYFVEAKSGNCSSTSRTMVTVNAGVVPVPPTTIGGATNPLCSGTGTVLSVTNPDATLKYSWYNVQTGGTALAEGNTFNVPALNTTTIYYVESSNAATGCISASRTAITVTVLGKLSAPVVSVQERTATSISFIWTAIPGASGYEVSLDGGATWIAPTAGPQGTRYLVAGLKPDQNVSIMVRAFGQLACQLSDASTLNGKSDNPIGNTIFVPNTFTPNNDGKNDIFYVYGNTIAKMRLRVYNQWGQFIYESLNIQNGWDGTFKGQIQPNGVYVYYLEADFNDGTKTTKKGTITLLR
jgi:gliding motility-associated-like protein